MQRRSGGALLEDRRRPRNADLGRAAVRERSCDRMATEGEEERRTPGKLAERAGPRGARRWICCGLPAGWGGSAAPGRYRPWDRHARGGLSAGDRRRLGRDGGRRADGRVAQPVRAGSRGAANAGDSRPTRGRHGMPPGEARGPVGSGGRTTRWTATDRGSFGPHSGGDHP